MLYGIRFLCIVGFFVFPHHLTFFIDGNWPIIKPSDIFSFILLILLPRKTVIDKFIKSYFFLIAIYLFSSVITFQSLGSLAVTAKLFQYLIVLISIKTLRTVHLSQVFKFILISVTLAFLLFIIGIDLGPSWGRRFYAVFGGPYELASIAILSLLMLRRSIKIKHRLLKRLFNLF